MFCICVRLAAARRRNVCVDVPPPWGALRKEGERIAFGLLGGAESGKKCEILALLGWL